MPDTLAHSRGILGRARTLAAPLHTALLLLTTFPLLLSAASPAVAAGGRVSYADAVEQTLSDMEQGRHLQAANSLRTALTLDRNDLAGILTLGTLYLHTGSPSRAAQEFARARTIAPDEPLAAWGEALAVLAQGKTESARHLLDLVSDQEIPTASTLRAYLRLMKGDASAIRQATANVTAEEQDLLRLEVAGFAALRGGDPARGIELLSALLARPDMIPLQESRTAVLSFLETAPLQGAAPALASAIVFPEPSRGAPLQGRVTLAPPAPLPGGVTLVTYTIEGGGGYTASVNYSPWATEWNTARFPNGLYTLRTACTDSGGRLVSETRRTVTVWNPDGPRSNLLNEEQRLAARKRLITLLTPRPARKAAHFALAEQAAKSGDTANALAHIESVVAIDPMYQNARASLRSFNKATIGTRDGIWRGTTTEKLVALTFDDGPNPAPQRTPALLDALKNTGASATFFVVGLRAEQSPDLLRRMVSDGHELANHSYSHPNLTFLDSYAVEKELCRTSVIIREATGKRPRFYRPPGGNFNTAVVGAAEAMGMAGAYWTVDGIKFESAPFTPAQLTKFVLSNVRPGAIVLLHNAPTNTINAVTDIVNGLRAKGYTLVTMSELARRCKPATGNATAVPPKHVK
jgi:peptidoglycan/xylan/chitin deacetylase (PgdA/CDA1 family)